MSGHGPFPNDRRTRTYRTRTSSGHAVLYGRDRALLAPHLPARLSSGPALLVPRGSNRAADRDASRGRPDDARGKTPSPSPARSPDPWLLVVFNHEVHFATIRPRSVPTASGPLPPPPRRAIRTSGSRRHEKIRRHGLTGNEVGLMPVPSRLDVVRPHTETGTGSVAFDIVKVQVHVVAGAW